MNDFSKHLDDNCLLPCLAPSFELTRRDLLWRFGGGLGGVALAAMLDRDVSAATDSNRSSNVIGDGGFLEQFHFPPKAKRVVQFFMAGAASHVDMFDYKPELEKRNGQPWDPGEKVELFQNGHGATFASPWSWKQYGQAGKHLSEITAPLGDVADDIAFI
ncbi:MAG: DUF1501 domain-containing protein, partial [Planctomycetes bacterium]|nr:DUF1501 domain-containing protein [Planctomycetota bacterium]